MKMKSIFSMAAILIVTVAATGASHSAHSSHGAGPRAGDVKSLDVYVDGGMLHALVAETTDEVDVSRVLYFRSSDAGETWYAPVRVDEGSPSPLARGRGTDFQLAASGDDLVAIWLTKGSGFGGRGPLVAKRSEDGGKTWLPCQNPADDGTDGDHAFIDVTATPEGDLHAVWLDARFEEGKGLVSARSRDGGKSWSANRYVDSETCECCWNVIHADAKGVLYTIYRDKDPRDMALAVSRDQGEHWTRISSVGDFGWYFDGCAHVGSGLAVEESRSGLRLHALAWTGKEESVGLYYLNTGYDALEWSAPQRIGGDWARFGDIAIDENGRLAVAWSEFGPDGARLVYTLSEDGGRTWNSPVVVATSGENPTHPRIVALGEAFHLFWTEEAATNTVWRHRRILPFPQIMSE